MIEAALFFAAFIPRLIFFLTQPYEDPAWSPHWNLATGLLKFGAYGYSGEKVTNIEPGYPFFLALARAVSGENYFFVILFQIGAASLAAVYLYRFGILLAQDRRTGIVAAFLYAAYPYLIGQSIEIIEVTLFTTLLIISAYYFLSPSSIRGSLFCGISLGILLLTRTMVIPAFLLGGVLLIFQKRLRDLALIFLTALAVAGPWFLRSHAVDGTWVPPRSGWNLLQGNCSYSDKIIPRYNPDLLDAYVSELLDRERPELSNTESPTRVREIDRFYKEKAVEFMRAYPWRTLRRKILNVFYLLHPRIVPFESMGAATRIRFTGPETFVVENIPERGLLKETAHTVTYSFIMITALAGIYLRRKRWREDLFLYLLAGNFIAVYSVYWPATRLRAPMDFILMLFSACFLVRKWKA